MRFHIPMIHFNFCNRCGRQIIQQIQLLKDQNQQVCPSCLEIHNAHPKVVCGTLVAKSTTSWTPITIQLEHFKRQHRK